jgi:hypothetical protein
MWLRDAKVELEAQTRESRKLTCSCKYDQLSTVTGHSSDGHMGFREGDES